MIGARRLEDLPAAAYDEYVRLHPSASPYHRLAWLAAVEEAYGHSGWIITSEGERGIEGVLPVCEVATPLARPRLVSLPFCDLGGPLASSPEVEDALLGEARALRSSRRAAYLELRRSGAPVCAEQGAHGRKVSLVLDLPEDSERLFAAFKPKLRSQIRKAEKNGITAEVTSGAGALDAFYPVFAENMRRLGSPVHSRLWFQRLKAHYGDDMVIGVARYRGECVGAGIVLRCGDRAAVPWASTVSQYNRLAPNMLLYWALLSHLSDSGCRRFDFGRSTLGEGTYRFKTQWGAEPHELHWQRSQGGGPPNGMAPASAAGLRARSVIEGTWRQLPLAMTNRLGPRIRKYITL